MTKIFTDLFLRTMSQNIPNKIITCNDKDAPWVTSELKTAIKGNSRVHRRWVLRGRNPDDRHLVQNETNRLIKEAKKDYYVNLGIKLSNFDTGSKTFWTAFKHLVNNKKLTNIPPMEDGKIISDFNLKSNIFNDYFAKQFTLNNISNTLPPLRMDTTSRIHSVDTSEGKIANIILKLN